MKKILILTILLYILLPIYISQAFEWSGIVVHHSATEQGTVESFRRYHTQVKGWEDVAYHYVIYKDGSIHKGRGLDKQGMHGDKRNYTHLGICLVGTNEFTEKQKSSLEKLCEDLIQTFNIFSVERHHEECPSEAIGVEKLEKQLIGK